jgi:lysophospholipase L1-like esterase
MWRPGSFPYIHHDLLGHVPNPGFQGIGSANSRVTISVDGLRYTGEVAPSGTNTILAVGDSYTYGEEVSDEEAWPAQLQTLTGRPVSNGGVSGYGLDQIVLRAELLAPPRKPSVVIVGFIADDIRRTEMRRLWWRDKPWFALESRSLVLKGVPVTAPIPLPFIIRNRTERVLIQLPPFLQHLVRYQLRVHPAGTGAAIALHLVARLARMQAELGVRIVMLALYHPAVWTSAAFGAEQIRLTRAVLERAKACGLAVIDSHQRFATEPRPARFYAAAHLNRRGNAAVASLLAARLPDFLATGG